MNTDAEQTDGFGLLACGVSGRWSVDLDESPDGTEWSMQLDGPAVYLAFAVRHPGVVREALDHLRSDRKPATALPLGHFGPAGVSLHRDDEDVARCFLVVGPTARSAVRVTLSADDVAMLIDALEQVLADLSPAHPLPTAASHLPRSADML